MKTFSGDLAILNDLASKKKPFAVVRFGDGEFTIIRDRRIDLRGKCMGEYKYDPNDKKDRELRDLLIDSISYKSPNYWVGIVCSCCGGNNVHNGMLKKVQSVPTWANIFVNSNYTYYKRTFLPTIIKNYKIVLVCNKKASLKRLPFKPVKVFTVGTNSWREDFDLINELVSFMEHKEGHAILVCAGPFSNILVYKVWLANPNNVVINAGSTLDPLFFNRRTRKYHNPSSKTANKTCIWGPWIPKK